MDDKTLRSRLIRLASEHPEFRDQILPVLKEGAGTGKAVTKDIRHPMYEAGDKIGALEDAIQSDPATSKDKALLAAVKNLQDAHSAVFKALKPYNWD